MYNMQFTSALKYIHIFFSTLRTMVSSVILLMSISARLITSAILLSLFLLSVSLLYLSSSTIAKELQKLILICIKEVIVLKKCIKFSTYEIPAPFGRCIFALPLPYCIQTLLTSCQLQLLTLRQTYWKALEIFYCSVFW